MFAGHIGAALAIGRFERRLNLGVLVSAALLLDLLLWCFVLLRWESVSIPVDFAATHQSEFDFPWSHGLAAAALWSVVAAALAIVFLRRRPLGRRAAVLVGAAVFSHWLLDALVHRPELPLLGAGSAQVGVGLWDQLPAALAVEAAIVAVGLWLYLPGSALPRGRRIALALLVAIVLVFTVLGMTIAPPPPSATAMAASSLATLAAVCALAGWLARRGGRL